MLHVRNEVKRISVRLSRVIRAEMIEKERKMVESKGQTGTLEGGIEREK